MFCRQLAPLIITLLDTASSCCCRKLQQLAATAIRAANAAAGAWLLSTIERSTLDRTRRESGQTSKLTPSDTAYGEYEVDSVPAIMTLAIQLLRQVLQLPSQQDSSRGISDSSSSSSSNSAADVQGTVEALLCCCTTQ